MADQSFLREFLSFAREKKAWWIVPLLLAVAMILVVMWQSSAGQQPFEYPT